MHGSLPDLVGLFVHAPVFALDEHNHSIAPVIVPGPCAIQKDPTTLLVVTPPGVRRLTSHRPSRSTSPPNYYSTARLSSARRCRHPPGDASISTGMPLGHLHADALRAAAGIHSWIPGRRRCAGQVRRDDVIAAHRREPTRWVPQAHAVSVRPGLPRRSRALLRGEPGDVVAWGDDGETPLRHGTRTNPSMSRRAVR